MPCVWPADVGAEGRGICGSASGGLLRPPVLVSPTVPTLWKEAASSSVSSGRAAPGGELPENSTPGSGGRRTAWAASPPSPHRFAGVGGLLAITSSGPHAESASSLSLSLLSPASSPSRFPMPITSKTSRNSPSTSAATGVAGAREEALERGTGVLALDVEGRGGVGAGDGANGLPAAAGASAAGSGPLWPPPGGAPGTLIRKIQTFFLSFPHGTLRTLPPRGVVVLHYAPPPRPHGAAPQRRGASKLHLDATMAGAPRAAPRPLEHCGSAHTLSAQRPACRRKHTAVAARVRNYTRSIPSGSKTRHADGLTHPILHLELNV